MKESPQVTLEVQARHKNLAPVMVIGYGSSGTSITSSLLREYLNIGIGTETQFIVRYYHRLAQYGDLADERNLRRLVKDIACERWFERNKKFGFHADTEAILRGVRDRSYRGVLDAILRHFAEQIGVERWGDKSPEYIYHLPTIHELFPDAQYIHVIRDGRDVTNSVMRRYWGAKNAYVGATEWSQGVRLIDDFVATLPPEKFMEVRYEDLLREPVPTFARLIEFLDVEDPDGALLECIAARINQDLHRQNFDKWKQWPERERIRFERIGCDVLQRHGYETILEGPDNTFTFWQRGYWRVHNKLLKWTYLRYWQDNVYKIKLRVADAWRSLRSKTRSK